MFRCTSLLALASTLFLASMAFAQTGGGTVVKWTQPPDLTTTGIDINATFPNILADDFLCTGSGPITDIHITGSWLNDLLPLNAAGAPDPSAVAFKLSIHADIPKGPQYPYSMPGQEIWSEVFQPGTYGVGSPISTQELFMTGPNTIDGTDTAAYQYTFIPTAPFVQQQGTIYWLDVQALPNAVAGVAPSVFGWKTSLYHWNDDAVYGTTPPTVGFPGTADNWVDLIYPDRSPYAGQSIDLAFDLTTVPEPSVLFGLVSTALLVRRRAN